MTAANKINFFKRVIFSAIILKQSEKEIVSLNLKNKNKLKLSISVNAVTSRNLNRREIIFNCQL